MTAKERPIPFNVPMVRALLDGTKTQTRRALRIQPPDWALNVFAVGRDHYFHEGSAAQPGKCWPAFGRGVPCPHGQPGDRLWGKETHWCDDEDGAILYAANVQDFQIVNQNKFETGSAKYNWTPSRFMPRAASRITLEITGVRVERLQDISEADALSEGVDGKSWPQEFTKKGHGGRSDFRDVWESISGPNSWTANPWVWVIGFKVLQE